jgi:hypothetical protein
MSRADNNQGPSRAVVVGLVLIVMLAVWQVLRVTTPWFWPWETFPSGTPIQHIIVAQEHSEFPGPTCAFAVARLWRVLDDTEIRALPVEDYPWSPQWSATPVPSLEEDGRTAFLGANGRELEALGGCHRSESFGMRWAQRNAEWDDRLRQVLAAPGAYYATFDEGEGLFVIDPQRRVAYYAYGEM